jgi:chemotaxis protein MotB
MPSTTLNSPAPIGRSRRFFAVLPELHSALLDIQRFVCADNGHRVVSMEPITVLKLRRLRQPKGRLKMMTNGLKRGSLLLPIIAPILLGGCVVWKSDYDQVVSQNQQLQQQNAADEQQIAADKAQIGRLQGAIKYTVNSDQVFAPGSWEMSAQGKQIISKMASQLAPTQQNKLVVNGYTDNAPIGPALMKEGVTSNQVLSQKRAEAVMQYLISKGLNPNLVSAHGFGEADPIASNNTAQGRAQNRRVEITLAGS